MIEKFEDTPFEKNHQSTVADDFYYRVYEDKWPVCDGHLLFVPKENSVKFITITLQATVQYGEKLVEEGKDRRISFWNEYERTCRTICDVASCSFYAKEKRRHRRVSWQCKICS